MHIIGVCPYSPVSTETYKDESRMCISSLFEDDWCPHLLWTDPVPLIKDVDAMVLRDHLGGKWTQESVSTHTDWGIVRGGVVIALPHGKESQWNNITRMVLLNSSCYKPLEKLQALPSDFPRRMSWSYQIIRRIELSLSLFTYRHGTSPEHTV